MWYIAPLRTQKLILFLLQHGTKNFTILLGGIFVGSLEGFAAVKRYAICCVQLSYIQYERKNHDIFVLDSEFIHFLFHDDLHDANNGKRIVEINRL